MSFLSQTAILDACRTLFGDEVNLDPEFLGYLQPSGAKSAFRTQAKQHHPDRFAAAAPEVRARQAARFREIHQAYRLLASYLDQRGHRRPPVFPVKPPPPPSQPRKHNQTDARSIPPLPLEFGIFAYYRGTIDYRDLIDALVWQRRQRPALGTIACRWGWLTEDKVRRVLKSPGVGGRFGRRAVDLGLLTTLQVEALLRYQRTRQQRLGQYFVDRGLLTAIEADQLGRDLEQHNACLGGGRR